MNYRIDHDLHIHSHLSLCSKDPEQTAERILRYAEENGLSQVCLTNHFWDESLPIDFAYYQAQPFAHLCEALPLPRSERVEFLFGAETEITKDGILGITESRFRDFDFVVIPTTHLHIPITVDPEEAATPEGRAAIWLRRLDALLDRDLPFEKIGLAHLAANKIAHPRENYLRVLELLPERELERLFARAAGKGVGIELNRSDLEEYFRDENPLILRPFRIAKDQGCKFYLGSDAHHPDVFDRVTELFARGVRVLDLKENDKFHVKKS